MENSRRQISIHPSVTEAKGGATFLKVWGYILRAKRAEIFLYPHFLASGGQLETSKLENNNH